MKSKNNFALFTAFILLTLTFTLTSFNQTFSQVVIKGKVTEFGSTKPIPGATVFAEKWNKGTTTDSKGNYELKIQSEDISEGNPIRLLVNASGFKAQFFSYFYYEKQKKLDVSLKSKDEFTVSSPTTKIYKIRYRNPEEIFTLIEPFLSSFEGAKATVSHNLKTITIKDRHGVHEKIENVIKEYDIPLKKIWLEVTIIEASQNGGEKKKFPAELEKVVKKLNTLFRFDNYEIVSRGDAMGMEESFLTFTSSSSKTPLKGFKAQARIGYFDEVIKLDDFKIGMPTGNDLVTSINIKNGETVVVGSSRGREDLKQGSLITVVTAKILQE